MNDMLEKECPLCGRFASGKIEVKVHFGFRSMNGTQKPQSYCKSCRVKERIKSLNSQKES